ncbi:hypothetical protein N7468_010773 [Penicillium chermesinum]|uniref:Uncharacterized protein n=1 Tax=Penicillium chermesinum TaxID=63820 RepID=A0A9W9N9X5_9EURO|nr:uncharacterized protein N7468_010773 [Penicillium chermesinum]KAJ5215094.1 hypothetical protein N7468_010773 [Penicillium chermesinum]
MKSPPAPKTDDHPKDPHLRSPLSRRIRMCKYRNFIALVPKRILYSRDRADPEQRFRISEIALSSSIFIARSGYEGASITAGSLRIKEKECDGPI